MHLSTEMHISLTVYAGMNKFLFIGGTEPDLSKAPFMQFDYNTVGRCYKFLSIPRPHSLYKASCGG